MFSDPNAAAACCEPSHCAGTLVKLHPCDNGLCLPLWQAAGMEDILPRNWRALPFVVAAAQTAPMLAAMPSHEWLQSLWAFVGSEHRRCFSQWPSEGTCATKQRRLQQSPPSWLRPFSADSLWTASAA